MAELMISKEDIVGLATPEELKELDLYFGSAQLEEEQRADRVGVHPAEMLKEYHTTAGLKINEKYGLGEATFRLKLIQEEADEVNEAVFEPRDLDTYKEEILKELCDLVYVCIGATTTFGWDFEEAFRRVHENNMGRMTQPDGTIKRRADGKVLKNKDYPKVDLKDLV